MTVCAKSSAAHCFIFEGENYLLAESNCPSCKKKKHAKESPRQLITRVKHAHVSRHSCCLSLVPSRNFSDLGSFHRKTII
jgi:hypothetical protein